MSRASSLRALSLRCRASFSETSGQIPIEIRFSLPAKRYLKRYALVPRGAISR